MKFTAGSVKSDIKKLSYFWTLDGALTHLSALSAATKIWTLSQFLELFFRAKKFDVADSHDNYTHHNLIILTRKITLRSWIISEIGPLNLIWIAESTNGLILNL